MLPYGAAEPATMICIIALIVTSILAIFSARYRPLAKEALDCVLRRMTLRKCQSGLDTRLKSGITGRVMRSSPRAARFIYRHFELLSWLFLVLMLWSIFSLSVSGYNYYKYGNCNGRTNGEEFCVFDPAGKSKFSSALSNYTGPMVFPDLGDNPKIGPMDAKVRIIEFGCYMCPYTKKAEPAVKRILQEYEGKVLFTFRDFPISASHENADFHSLAARCAEEQGKYWEFRDYLFANQETMEHTVDGMIALASSFGLDQERFAQCMISEKYLPDILRDIDAGMKAEVYGTPTFFINNQTVVGPRDYKTFKKIIEKELNGSSTIWDSIKGIFGGKNEPGTDTEGLSCSAAAD